MFQGIVLLFFALLVVAVPKPEEKKDRVYDRELSDQEHFQSEHHNPQYDHEAFLGEEAKTFDQLPPEESKRRLGYVKSYTDNFCSNFTHRINTSNSCLVLKTVNF